MMEKEFRFNKNNVCLNHNVIEVLESNKNAKTRGVIPGFYIKTAVFNGKWIYGYDITLHNGGRGEPCMQRTCKKTATQSVKLYWKHVRRLENIFLSTNGHQVQTTLITR